MASEIKVFEFKTLPIEIEIKDLKFIKELPRLLGQPHKATFNQLIWLSEGEAKLYIDFREITLKANEVLVVASGQVCQFDIESNYFGKNILFTSSFYAITETDSNFLYTSEIFNPANLNRAISVCPLFINNLIMLLEEELKRPFSVFQTKIAHSYLQIILLESERQLNTHYHIADNNIARKFNNAVEQHFKQNKAVDFYIQTLGINEKALAKEVKCLTNNTPKVYIDSRVILEAKRLLSYSSLSIKEIGFELGFDEATNFNKYFRKNTGMTPLEFRDSMKNNLQGGKLPS